VVQLPSGCKSPHSSRLCSFHSPPTRSAKPTQTTYYETHNFIFRSVAYEEQWADKQERAFVRWINAHLDRVDVFNEAARDPYAAHSNALKRAQVRRMAALLLQAETTRMVFAKIDTVPQILKLKKHLLTPQIKKKRNSMHIVWQYAMTATLPRISAFASFLSNSYEEFFFFYFKHSNHVIF